MERLFDQNLSPDLLILLRFLLLLVVVVEEGSATEGGDTETGLLIRHMDFVLMAVLRILWPFCREGP
jgi:hypothetical protein